MQTLTGKLGAMFSAPFNHANRPAKIAMQALVTMAELIDGATVRKDNSSVKPTALGMTLVSATIKNSAIRSL